MVLIAFISGACLSPAHPHCQPRGFLVGACTVTIPDPSVSYSSTLKTSENSKWRQAKSTGLSSWCLHNLQPSLESSSPCRTLSDW